MKERRKEQVSISAFNTDGSYANVHHVTEADITTTTELLNAPLVKVLERSVTNLKLQQLTPQHADGEE